MTTDHPPRNLIGEGLPTPAGEVADAQLLRQALSLLVDEQGRDVRPPECQADVPVAALVVDAAGRVVGSAINRREADHDPTAHAEVLALRQAAQAVGDGWRLEDCTLVVTLEPCTMCAGAALSARVGRILFGAWEPKTGACGSALDVVRVPGQLYSTQVKGGVLEAECAAVLTDFFAHHRAQDFAQEL